LGYIAKAIGGNRASCRIFDSKRLQWNSELAHIPRRSWRVVVAIFRFEFFRGDVSMSKDMLDDNASAFIGDLWKQSLYFTILPG
jgi:hypothetical protein